MAPAYLFTTKGEIMALKSKTNELPEEFDVTEKKQVSFDDLEFEAEYVDEEELENGGKKFYTISGKESQYNPNWEKYGIQDFDVGEDLEGTPELNIFENKDKSYNALRLRLIDEDEIVDLYLNFPKKDFPYVTGINKYFDFYRTCFDFIYSILRWQDETNVVNADGEETNRFNKVNLENFAKFVDQHERVKVRITSGTEDSDYNSWIILDMK